MTRPDAATEALAEIVRLIVSAVKHDAELNVTGTALMVQTMLQTRGYVIRKARKSG